MNGTQQVTNIDGFVGINPPELHDGTRLYTQAIIAPQGRTLWVSGLIGATSDNKLVEGGKAAQIIQAFKNLKAVFAAAGCPPNACVRLTEYVVDYVPSDVDYFIPEIQALFDPARLPANAIVPVPRLGRDGALFEVDAFAIMPD
jgi:enamine deaminase RidA (YjgF/YER057c/UK114 family)